MEVDIALRCSSSAKPRVAQTCACAAGIQTMQFKFFFLNVYT